MANTYRNFLQTEIEFLKGVGPARADLLKKELNIFTYRDLLMHFPFRYVDRSKIWAIRDLDDQMPYIQVKGVLQNYKKEGIGKSMRAKATLNDGTGHIELVWFQGLKWLDDFVKNGQTYIAFGKPSVFRNIISITHPELSLPEREKFETGIQPVYSIAEKMRARNFDSRAIAKVCHTLVHHPEFYIQENLPDSILDNLQLVNRKMALKNIHFPENIDMANAAIDRLKFEELFFLQLKILHYKQQVSSQKTNIIVTQIGEQFNNFYNTKLPFELTDAQKKVLKEIRTDLGLGKQMNRLLQGDVGSGKTIVALLSMLMMADNNYQCCLMAPTEILATQHYKSISELLYDTGITCRLLTGSTSNSVRKDIDANLLNGEIHILIGTHALIEDKVQFRNLGLAVIDEQHRFGVAQRYKLWKKNQEPPHILVMTATPIPRTLAMTLYGDLDISVIDQLPQGRKPIRSVHRYLRGLSDVYTFIKTQIAEGRQIYIVYPLIDESEKLDYEHLMGGYEELKQIFPEPQYTMGMVHGKMKPKEKENVMSHFAKGDIHILVATTVIEVGVNVPNASVMMLMSAERFGLSQMHQLRGRVGRGVDQSFCILVTGDKLGADTRKRLKTMVDTTDGFVIAEVDMELRGPGDLEGTRQSGMLDLKLASISVDHKWVALSRQQAQELLVIDPLLQLPENSNTSKYFELYKRQNGDWGRVS